MGRPPSIQASESKFHQRFGWYLLGVAIGLIMLGMLWQARYRAHMLQQQQQQQGQPPASAPAAPPAAENAP